MTSGETDYLTFGLGEFTLTTQQEADFLQVCLDSPNCLYIVGLIDGEIVATANIGASDRARLSHRGELGMSVRKPH